MKQQFLQNTSEITYID